MNFDKELKGGKKNSKSLIGVVQMKKIRPKEEDKAHNSLRAINSKKTKENRIPHENLKILKLPSIKGANKKSIGSITFSKSEKLFVADIDYPDVISCLRSRGWRQCNDYNADRFTLKWVRAARHTTSLKSNQIANHVSHIDELSTKVKCCKNLKKLNN